MKLEFSSEALSDLQELKHYISVVLKNRKAASRISKMILNDCNKLKSHPELGMSLAAKTGVNTDLRFIICENWIVFYHPSLKRENTLTVTRILDGRRDYLSLLFIQQ